MTPIFKIISHSKSLWPYYLVISVITILVSLVNLLMPLLTGWAIDEIQKGSQANATYLVGLAVAIFTVDFVYALLSNVGGYYGDIMAAKLKKFLSMSYYQKLLELPQNYFDTELSGTIINRLNRSITQITNFMQMMSNNFLQFIFTTVFALIIIAVYSWQVALLLFLLYPIYTWMTFKTSSKWQAYQKEINTNSDIASGRFAESINQVKVVKSFTQELRELKFFNRHADKIIKTTYPQSKYWHSRDMMRRFVLSAIFFGVYLFIFLQALDGQLTAGQAVALILYAIQIRIPIFTISFLVENTQRAISDSKDYFEVMALASEKNDSDHAAKLRVSNAAIEFKDVSFGYDKNDVLKNISLTFEPDSKVALVGESGEGKTTLTNLLIRLYQPNKGSIKIDGQDITNVAQKSLRQSIGVVFQEPALFSGTIAENIAYAKPTASQKSIESAARAANAHDFIKKLPKGYATEIGERGLKLSGGQKQRIAIARALLKDAPILILDEATSSLDSRSETLVQDALERLMKGRTTIIIAHRLSTISHVDKIITLKNGRINETGSPEELAKTNGIYAKLLAISNLQAEKAKKKLKSYDLSL
jgi:ATP-binding cassette subfamily B protein